VTFARIGRSLFKDFGKFTELTDLDSIMSGGHFNRNHQPPRNAFNSERLGPDRNRRNYNGGANERTITRDHNLQNDRQITFLDSSQMRQTDRQNEEQHSRSHNSPPPQRGRLDQAPNTQPYRSSNGHPRSDPPIASGEDSRNFHRSNSHRSPERSIAQRNRKPIMDGRSTNVAQRSPSTPSSRHSDQNDVRHNRQGPYSRLGPDNSNRRWDRPVARDTVIRNTSPPRRNETARQDSRTSSSRSSRGSQSEDHLNRDGNSTAEGSEPRHARRDPPVQPSCDTQSKENATEEEHPAPSKRDTLSFITSKDEDQDDLDFENDDEVVTDADPPQPDASLPEQRDRNRLDLNDVLDSTGRSHREESTTKTTTSPRKESEGRGPSSPQSEEDRHRQGVSHNNSTKGKQKESTDVDREPPAPWKREYSRRDGRVYYHNPETDENQNAFPENETKNGHGSNSVSSTQASTSPTEDRKRKTEDERERPNSNYRGSSSRPGQRPSGTSGKGNAREGDPTTILPTEKRPRRDYNDSRGRNDHPEARHRFPEAQSRPNIPMPLVSQEELYRQQELDRRPNRPSFPARGPRPMEPSVRRRPRESPPPAPLPLNHVPNRAQSPPRKGRSFEDNSRADDPRRRRDNHPIPPRFPRRPLVNPNDVPLPPLNRGRSSQPSSSSNTSQDTRQYRDSNRPPSNRRDDAITNSRTERNGSHKDNETAPYHQSRHRQG
jgi:hypothetical protein